MRKQFPGYDDVELVVGKRLLEHATGHITQCHSLFRRSDTNPDLVHRLVRRPHQGLARDRRQWRQHGAVDVVPRHGGAGLRVSAALAKDPDDPEVIAHDANGLADGIADPEKLLGQDRANHADARTSIVIRLREQPPSLR